MPFTLVAFDEARTAVTTIATVDGEDDEHIQVIGDDIFVPKFNKLIGCCAGHGEDAVAGSASQAYLDSPSLRRITRHEIAPLGEFAAAPIPEIAQMFPGNPIVLDEGEALNAYLANTAVCAAGRGIVGVWLADGALAPVKGDIRTILCTSVVAGTLGVWTNGPLTLAYDLPAGRYQLVGAQCLSATTFKLFRFIFPEQWARPGGIASWLITSRMFDIFRKGNLGSWGEFTHRTLPRLEVLSADTVANPPVYLDIIKIA